MSNIFNTMNKSIYIGSKTFEMICNNSQISSLLKNETNMIPWNLNTDMFISHQNESTERKVILKINTKVHFCQEFLKLLKLDVLLVREFIYKNKHLFF